MICYYPVRFETDKPNVNISDHNVTEVTMELGIYDDTATANRQEGHWGDSHTLVSGKFTVRFAPNGAVQSSSWEVGDLRSFGDVLTQNATKWATSYAKELWSATNGDFADYRGD